MIDGKIVNWVPDTDLRNGHQGLADIAHKKLKIDVDTLPPGEFVMFVNSSWTAFKIYAANHMILHHKQPEGHRLNPKATMLIPHFLRGQRINYDKALTHVIEAEYTSNYGHLERSPE